MGVVEQNKVREDSRKWVLEARKNTSYRHESTEVVSTAWFDGGWWDWETLRQRQRMEEEKASSKAVMYIYYFVMLWCVCVCVREWVEFEGESHSPTCHCHPGIGISYDISHWLLFLVMSKRIVPLSILFVFFLSQLAQLANLPWIYVCRHLILSITLCSNF